TLNPLVLLYSAPACPVGSSMRVRFAIANTPWTATSLKPCAGGLSMNFYIAGLQQNSIYYLQHDVVRGAAIAQTGPGLVFPTSSAGILAPAATVLKGPTPPSSVQQPVLLQSLIYIDKQKNVYTPPVATDLQGNIIWYNPNGAALARPVPGGNMLTLPIL